MEVVLVALLWAVLNDTLRPKVWGGEWGDHGDTRECKEFRLHCFLINTIGFPVSICFVPLGYLLAGISKLMDTAVDNM